MWRNRNHSLETWTSSGEAKAPQPLRLGGPAVQAAGWEAWAGGCYCWRWAKPQGPGQTQPPRKHAGARKRPVPRLKRHLRAQPQGPGRTPRPPRIQRPLARPGEAAARPWTGPWRERPSSLAPSCRVSRLHEPFSGPISPCPGSRPCRRHTATSQHGRGRAMGIRRGAEYPTERAKPQGSKENKNQPTHRDRGQRGTRRRGDLTLEENSVTRSKTAAAESESRNRSERTPRSRQRRGN